MAVLVYAFVSVRFLSGCIVTLLSDHGDIVCMFDARTYPWAKKMATNEISTRQCEKLYPNQSVEIEWVDSPYKHFGVKAAMEAYERKNEKPFNGSTGYDYDGAFVPRF